MKFEGVHSTENGERTEDREDRGSPLLSFAVTNDEPIDGHYLHSAVTNDTHITAWAD